MKPFSNLKLYSRPHMDSSGVVPRPTADTHYGFITYLKIASPHERTTLTKILKMDSPLPTEAPLVYRKFPLLYFFRWVTNTQVILQIEAESRLHDDLRFFNKWVSYDGTKHSGAEIENLVAEIDKGLESNKMTVLPLDQIDATILPNLIPAFPADWLD